MNDFLEELQGSSLTPQKRAALVEQFEEWLTEAIDDGAKCEVDYIKAEILKKNKGGEFKTVGAQKIIEGKCEINCCNLRNPVLLQKMSQNWRMWEEANLFVCEKEEEFPYRDIMYSCASYLDRFHLKPRTSKKSVTRTRTKFVRGFFRNKIVEETYTDHVHHVALTKWGCALCDAIKKYAEKDRIQISFLATVADGYVGPSNSSSAVLDSNSQATVNCPFFHDYKEAEISIEYRVAY